jgi:hypothetical protein
MGRGPYGHHRRQGVAPPQDGLLGTSDGSMADMRSVDAKPHTLVANLRSRRAAK